MFVRAPDTQTVPGLPLESGAPAPSLRTRVPDVLAASALLLGLAFGLTGWFSADEVVMSQQISTLVERGAWTIENDPAAVAIDPFHEFALLARSDRLDGDIAPYVKHPIAPLTYAGAEWVFGPGGRIVVNAMAVVATALLLSMALGWSRSAFWLPVIGTTAPFHATVLWAHAPALFLATAAAVVLARLCAHTSRRWVDVAGLSAAIGLLSLYRSEGLLLAGALSVSLGLYWVRAGDRRRLLAAALPSIVALAVYVGEPIVRGILLGSSSALTSVPSARAGQHLFGARLGVLRIVTIQPTVNGSSAGRLLLPGLVLLLAASVLAGRGRLKDRPLLLVLAAGVAMYLPAVASGPVPGFFVAMPLLTIALPWLRFSSALDVVAVTAVGIFGAAVVATSYDQAGGGDWGARYLLIAVPFLLLLVHPALARLPDTDAGKAVLVAGFVAAGLVQAGVLVDVADRGDTVAVVDDVAATIADLRASDPGLVVAVSDERLSRFLYDRGVRGPSFHVAVDRENGFDGLLDDAGTERIAWVDLESAGLDRDGELVETHGSVTIRTAVRR